MAIEMHICDNIGQVLSVTIRPVIIPRVGEHVTNNSFALHRLPTTMKVFSVAHDMSSRDTIVRVYVQRP